MVKTIKKIIEVIPYKLLLAYNNEEMILVDLSHKLEEWGSNPDSKFAELKDPALFCSVKLNTELGFVYWPNGIDLCPDVLYEMGVKQERRPKLI